MSVNRVRVLSPSPPACMGISPMFIKKETYKETVVDVDCIRTRIYLILQTLEKFDKRWNKCVLFDKVEHSPKVYVTC